MSALATGEYQCVLLFAEKRAGRKAHTLHFVLLNGERHFAAVMPKKLTFVIGPSKFRRTYSATSELWMPADPSAKQPVVTLHLKFDAKYQNNSASVAHVTGEHLVCDIRRVDESTLGYEEF